MFSSGFELFLFVPAKPPSTTNEHANGIVPSRFVWNCLRVCQRGPGFRQPTCGTLLIANLLGIHNIEAIREPTMRSIRETTVLRAAHFCRRRLFGVGTYRTAECAALGRSQHGRQNAHEAQR